MLEFPRKIRWSKSQINNKSVLFPVMAWRRTGDKPLPESMMTHVNDAYMRPRPHCDKEPISAKRWGPGELDEQRRFSLANVSCPDSNDARIDID